MAAPTFGLVVPRLAFLPPLKWWPSFLQTARSAGYLVPNVRSSAEVTLSASSILRHGVTSDGMVTLTKIAFLCLDVSLEDQVAFHFTGHSFRHFFPCIAEMLAWLASIRNELGRWSTGAANAKRTLCGPRYTVKANQALQIFICRVAVQRVPSCSTCLMRAPGLPFLALTSLHRVMKYGPHPSSALKP
jgi:hypothetical protein